jgi:hypothetical protein
MTPAGHSGTPLPKKLGIKPGATVAFPGAPDAFAGVLGELPDGARVRARLGGQLDVIVLFVTRRAELARRFPAAVKSLDADGGLWVAWPKKSSGVDTDLSFEVVQRTGLDAGLVDNKIAAVDETWSGLRFVCRVADRPARRR